MLRNGQASVRQADGLQKLRDFAARYGATEGLDIRPFGQPLFRCYRSSRKPKTGGVRHCHALGKSSRGLRSRQFSEQVTGCSKAGGATGKRPRKARPKAAKALKALERWERTTRKDGAGDRSRTYDLRITNALLYQLSYTGTKLSMISLRLSAMQAWSLPLCDGLWRCVALLPAANLGFANASRPDDIGREEGQWSGYGSFRKPLSKSSYLILRGSSLAAASPHPYCKLIAAHAESHDDRLLPHPS